MGRGDTSGSSLVSCRGVAVGLGPTCVLKLLRSEAPDDGHTQRTSFDEPLGSTYLLFVSIPRALRRSLAALILLGAAAPASAEDTLPPAPAEFATASVGWLEVSYHPSARDEVRRILADAPTLHEQLLALAGPSSVSRVHVRVAGDVSSIQALWPTANPTTGHLAEPSRVISLAASGDRLLPAPLTDRLRSKLVAVTLPSTSPSWLSVGAEGFLLGRSWAESWVHVALPLALDEIHRPETRADLIRHLTEEYPGALPRFIADLSLGIEEETAFRSAFGQSLAQTVDGWKTSAKIRYLLPVVIVLGLLAFAGSRLWRGRQRSKSFDLQDHRVTGPLPRMHNAGRRFQIAVADDGITAQSRTEIPLPPRPEVPQVEHEGNWHTLH